MPQYKNETTGKWYCSFYYSDWQGKRKKKKKEGFNTKREAKDWENEFIHKTSADCSMTFRSLVELYKEDIAPRIKPTTKASKEFMIDTKLLPFFGDMAINSITATTVRKWQTELISSPENYSQTYLKTINNQLSAIFNFAVKYYSLKSNPARDCGSMGKKKADSMQFWTQAEFNSFISVVDDITDRTIFMLLYYSGMRSGELFALTLSDFDFALKTVSINKNYARQNGEDLILTPKTEKSKRIVSLPDFMIAAIKEYANKLYDLSLTQRLFPSNKYTLNKHMVKYCKKANVKKIRIHDLRHSHASLLIELGFSPLLISERLGHENIETTLQTYSHLYPNKQSEVASKLEELHNNF